jgi:hypothetical protein
VRLLRNTPRHRLLTVLTVSAAAAALAGCGSNINAQTQEWYNPTDGANTDVESTLQGMAVRNLILVSDGTDATVIATFVNNGSETDSVERIVVDGAEARIDSSVEVDPNQVAQVGPDAETSAVVEGTGLAPGSITPVEISFGSAPQVTLDAVVRSPTGDFADLGP